MAQLDLEDRLKAIQARLQQLRRSL